MKLTINEISELYNETKTLDEIYKCRAISKAENIGKTGVFTYQSSLDEYGREIIDSVTLTYKNGTSITFEGLEDYRDTENLKEKIEKQNDGLIFLSQNPVVLTTEDGKSIPYLNNHTGGNWASIYEVGDMEGNVTGHEDYGQSKKFFETHEGTEIEKLDEEERKNFDKFVQRGRMGGRLDEYLRGERTREEIIQEGKDYDAERPWAKWEQDFTEMLDYEPTFREIVSKNHIDGDFITAQVINDSSPFDNDIDDLALTKKVTTNTVYNRESSGGEIEHLTKVHGRGNNWLVLTVREGSNKANCGVDIQNPKSGNMYRDYRTGNMTDAYFITAPGQKYVKEVVDYDNHIIIRTPKGS